MKRLIKEALERARGELEIVSRALEQEEKNSCTDKEFGTEDIIIFRARVDALEARVAAIEIEGRGTNELGNS